VQYNDELHEHNAGCPVIEFLTETCSICGRPPDKRWLVSLHNALDIKLIRLLLWLVRVTRSELQWDRGRITYRWVFSHDGSFDHWFDTPEGPRAVQWCLGGGIWPTMSWLLSHSIFCSTLRGRVEADHIHARSEIYYCTSPLFAARDACRS
jgi:hypothetical protein